MNTLVDPHDLVGAAEAAKITGMNVSAFKMASSRGIAPQPIATLICGRIWLRSQIEEWTAIRNAKRLS